MCLKWLFKKPTRLPYPEEPVDASKNVSNTQPDEVLQQWLTQRGVPSQYWDFWKSKIDIRLYDTWPANMLNMGIKADTPACTWEENGIRILASLAKWFNVGVVAHEQAHSSYAMLSDIDKAKFSVEYNKLKSTNQLIILLFSINTYGLSSDIEAHADVYRYIGEQMPDILKQYYPKLF